MTHEDTNLDADRKSMDDIMSLCKRRGFVYQASEIYGGINGFWDYGPLGAILKKNLRDAWWQDVVLNPCGGKPGPDGQPVSIVPVDTCIIQNPKVWEASGHVAGFNDPMIDDKETKGRFRADHLMGVYVLDGAITSANAAAAKIRDSVLDPTRVPDFTVIASNPSEAAAQLVEDKKLRKVLGIKDAEIADVGVLGQGRLIAITTGRGDFFAFVDTIPDVVLKELTAQVPSPFTGKPGSLTPPRAFNLMFKTYVGATASEDDIAYLRPETAQGIFIHFKNVVDTTRVRVPFGIAQIGKAFRNEVTPRNFTFRSREFEQMEIEFFCHPDEAHDWYAFWRDWRMAWWQSLGLAGDNLILREHDRDELAHYAKAGAGTSDVEYRFPFTSPGFGELEGIAHRTDFDLKQHQDHAKVKMDYFDTERGELAPNGQPKGERYIPHCIEPSAGLDRGVLAALCEAYTPDPTRPSGVFMKFHPRLAPIKAGVFPLVNKDGMPEVAEKLHADLHSAFIKSGRAGGIIELDAKQNIGKRYARMDEAGCPFCFTVDGETANDQAVTVRHRDTQQQERVALDKVVNWLDEKFKG